MGEQTVEAADLLTKLISETEFEHQKDFYQKIKAIETECDGYVDAVFKQLNDAFSTPINREDLHELCSALDDVVDLITSSAKRFVLYRPKNVSNKVMHMAEIILEDCKCIRTALAEMKVMTKKPEVALEMCQRMHELEHEGDDVFDNFVKDLFETEADAIELIKVKDIMQAMESATDRANSVGKALKTIIVKYA